jgi:hypothetical protein
MEGSEMIDLITSMASSANSCTRMFESPPLRFASQLTRVAARVGGLLVFGAMAVLEPLVRFLLATLATLGMFVTIVFGFFIAANGFPKWTMLGMSMGCFLLLGLYYRAMSVFEDLATGRDGR